MNEIKSQVLQIIKNLENGIEADKHQIDDGYDEGEIINGFDYLADVLDINYILDSEKNYKGARILVAFGGPNIWIDTSKNTVEGYWWGESYTDSFTVDAMDIDGALMELYSC
jgi:hypothetical protein